MLVIFHAWSGNKGVMFRILTLLTLILTPGVEIKGLKWAFQVISQQLINKNVNLIF